MAMRTACKPVGGGGAKGLSHAYRLLQLAAGLVANGLVTTGVFVGTVTSLMMGCVAGLRMQRDGGTARHGTKRCTASTKCPNDTMYGEARASVLGGSEKRSKKGWPCRIQCACAHACLQLVLADEPKQPRNLEKAHQHLNDDEPDNNPLQAPSMVRVLRQTGGCDCTRHTSTQPSPGGRAAYRASPAAPETGC